MNKQSPALLILIEEYTPLKELSFTQWEDGTWSWEFRCAESEDTHSSLEDALLNFVASQINVMDEMFNWKPN